MTHLILRGQGTLFLVGCAAEPKRGNPRMNSDEQSIRQWFESWIKSTKEGDLPLARSLIGGVALLRQSF
jgi:hypothetical protein